MNEVYTTPDFDHWLRKLKDRHARLRIVARVERLGHGNPGDIKSIGGGVSELRLPYGPGYRIYLTRRGATFVLLLCGGDKSTQQNDIATARRLAAKWFAQEDSHDE